MTAQERQWVKWGAILATLLTMVGLLSAAKSQVRELLVTRSEYREHFIRDSLWKRDVDLKLESIDGKLDDVFQCIRRPECR